MNTIDTSSTSFCSQEVSPRSKRVRFAETVYFCEQQLMKSLEEMEKQQQQSPLYKDKEGMQAASPTSFLCSSDCRTSNTIQGQNDYYSSSLSLLGYRVKPKSVPL